MTSGRTIVRKRDMNWYLKRLLSSGKSMALSWQPCVWLLFNTSAWEKSRCSTKYKSSTWHQSILWHGRLHTLQICLKYLQAAQIDWSLERNGAVNISALTENSFKAFPTELCDFTEDHPISKIHNQELVLSPRSTLKCILLCVLALWDAIIPISAKTSSTFWIRISSPSQKKEIM